MKPRPDHLDILEQLSSRPPSQPELVFDDEPLEDLLYGKRERGPTSASLFIQSRKHLAGIQEAYKKGDIQAVIDESQKLVFAGCAISVGTCAQIAGIMRKIVPHIPNPVMRFDLAPLKPLLEKIWQTGMEKRDDSLLKKAGTSLYQWYQHHQHYEKARSVMRTLIDIHVREGDRSEEAVTRNNYAFEYFLEGRFLEAIPEFDKAVVIFEQMREEGQCANSRANSWMCRYELGDLGEIRQTETELRRLAGILKREKLWQARKPLILLARIAERDSRIEEAIALVEQAVEACKHTHTHYPEMDGKYLTCLKTLKAPLC